LPARRRAAPPPRVRLAVVRPPDVQRQAVPWGALLPGALPPARVLRAWGALWLRVLRLPPLLLPAERSALPPWA
jgi:hypothetical protein